MAAVLRTGVDLIEVERVQRVIARQGNRFLERVFTPNEIKEAGGQIHSLAARFAAKEAVAKAFGTGIGPMKFVEIEVRRGSTGAPELHLHGAAEAMAREQGLSTWSLSLSHSETHAIAMVVVLGNMNQG